jgi:hypothetical protein
MFLLSHEEKCPWLELSMGGQPWRAPWPVMGELAREGREEEGEGERWARLGGAYRSP